MCLPFLTLRFFVLNLSCLQIMFEFFATKYELCLSPFLTFMSFLCWVENFHKSLTIVVLPLFFGSVTSYVHRDIACVPFLPLA